MRIADQFPESRIIAAAEHCDPVMLPRAVVYALAKCAFALRANMVALELHSDRALTGFHLRAAHEAIELLESTSRDLPPTHIRGLNDLRDAS